MARVNPVAPTDNETSALEQQLKMLLDAHEVLRGEAKETERQRDEYKRCYLELMERCRMLELGILQKRERSISDSTTMSMLEMLLGESAKPPPEPPKKEIEKHTRKKPTGRKPLPADLPRVDIEVIPPEVQAAGLDAYDVIGEDVSESVERRSASLVVVRVHKPKFALKGRDKLEDCKVLQAASPELPIERGLAGPGLLAETVVRRFLDHMPLHRLERIYGREGLELARSTICGWHTALAALLKGLIDAMWSDAMLAPYLCADATGVLVQDLEKCRHGHFFVVIAPEQHVLFAYSPKHNAKAVDALVAGYKGYFVADAHAVYDHLFLKGDVIECGCASHARRYFFKALGTDPDRAHYALALFGALFRIERELASASPEVRKAARLERSKPVLDRLFEWCDEQAPLVLDETPISRAIGYARNQRKALCRFLEDGRLPIHNNWSERELRREALGRKNWIFLGSDEGGDVNATFVTLIASCQLHGIEPLAYLRDLLCLMPSWPAKRVLELAPANWKKTLEQDDAQQRLAANVYRQVALGKSSEHPPAK